MHALVIIAHPCQESFTHAAAARAQAGLRRAGHEVSTLDLYEVGFTAAMSREERIAYHSASAICDPLVEEHARLLRSAQILVFVYPTWWSGLPAIMKGWLERVMVPGVGFTYDPATHRIGPNMQHIRHIVGVSTYGSPRRYVKLINDNGRRVLTRALRMSCGHRPPPRTWLALYSMDTTTEDDRARFLARVEQKLAAV